MENCRLTDYAIKVHGNAKSAIQSCTNITISQMQGFLEEQSVLKLGRKLERNDQELQKTQRKKEKY